MTTLAKGAMKGNLELLKRRCPNPSLVDDPSRPQEPPPLTPSARDKIRRISVGGCMRRLLFPNV